MPRSRRRNLATLLAMLLAVPLTAFALRPAADSDVTVWWQLITTLSSDAMRGRDTGSPEHRQAAELVAEWFSNAGLRPAGEQGGFLQSVPLKEVRVEKAGTSYEIVDADGRATALRFLHQITVRPSAALPEELNAPVVFRGYCGTGDVGPDAAGKLVLCVAGRRRGMPSGAERLAAVRKAGAAGMISIDDIGFTLEPPRWPQAYARTVDHATNAARMTSDLVQLRLNPTALAPFLAGTDRTADALLRDIVAARPLPSLDLAVSLRARFNVTEHQYSSDNVLALLPGTDPSVADEVIVVNAHLDGYGIGEAIDGDSIYNGAFDDAAYVATLVRLAQVRRGEGYRRPLLFAVFTGEEKGLLGSRWFLEHPTVPRGDLAAVITLDAIRPLFPLRALTLIGGEASSLRTLVEAAAQPLGISIRPDLEPERGMIDRTDASPFLRAGIPAVAFMFAYDSGSPEQAKYREWYRVRYHTPQDDVTQPIDMTAAADFNRFVASLVSLVGDAATRPAMTPVAR